MGKAFINVTLDAVSYRVEGDYSPAEPYDRDTPAEPETFDIDLVWCELLIEQESENTASVEVSEVLGHEKLERIKEAINERLSELR